jgi:hypothetical protein
VPSLRWQVGHYDLPTIPVSASLGASSLTERPGFIRLIPMQAEELVQARNTLTQQVQHQALEFAPRIELNGVNDGVHAGIARF